jgi:hypothetical protein
MPLQSDPANCVRSNVSMLTNPIAQDGPKIEKNWAISVGFGRVEQRCVRRNAGGVAGTLSAASEKASTMQNAIVHSIPEACSIACAGRTALYEAIRSGALRAVKRGRRTLILDVDLRQWVQSLPPVPVKQPDTKQQRGAISGATLSKGSSGRKDDRQQSSSLESRSVT